MKTWQITEPGSIQLFESKEALPDGYVKVRLNRCAVSALDMEFFTGMESAVYPFVPVRLGMGIVSETGDENGALKRGQRVVIEPYINTPEGKTLTMGKNAEGLLRDFVSVPAANAHALPEHVSDDEAVFTDLIAIGLCALDKLKLQKGEHIAIIGASAIGIIMAELAIYYQAVPILIDARQNMLDIAAESGVYYTVNTSETDALKKVTEITGGRLCETAAYITTAVDKAQKTLDFSAPEGRAVFVGAGNLQNAMTMTVNLNSIAAKKLSIAGISDGDGFTTRAINMLANKSVDVKPLITRTITFDEIPLILKQIAVNPLTNIILNVKI